MVLKPDQVVQIGLILVVELLRHVLLLLLGDERSMTAFALVEVHLVIQGGLLGHA